MNCYNLILRLGSTQLTTNSSAEEMLEVCKEISKLTQEFAADYEELSRDCAEIPGIAYIVRAGKNRQYFYFLTSCSLKLNPKCLSAHSVCFPLTTE